MAHSYSSEANHLFVGALIRTSTDHDLRERFEAAAKAVKARAEASAATQGTTAVDPQRRPERVEAEEDPFASVSGAAPVRTGRKIRIMASATTEASDRMGIVEVAARHATASSNPMRPRAALAPGPGKALTASASLTAAGPRSAVTTRSSIRTARDPGALRGELLALLQRSKAAYLAAGHGSER